MRIFNAVLVFALCWMTYVTYFQRDVTNPQQVTRMALALAFTEGRLDLAPFENQTVDKAEYDGHIYADKPPGLSLLATPVLLAFKSLRALSGHDVDVWDTNDYLWMARLAAATTVALLSSLAVAALYLVLPSFGVSPAAALFAATALGFGTPFFGWSTTFFVHAPSGVLILLALLVAHRSRTRTIGWADLLLGFLLGALLSFDLTSLPAACAIGVYVLTGRGDHIFRRLMALAPGGLVGLLPLLIYNALAFGSPLHFGYSNVIGFEGMKTGFFGLNLPNPEVTFEILFGLYRGLLPLSPVLLLLPIGMVALWRQRELRGFALTIAVIALAAILINSSYFYWYGGSSTGPRHLVAMLPILAIPLAFAWPTSRLGQGAALCLLGLSLGVSLICASTMMFADEHFPNPMMSHLLPMALSPDGLRRMVGILAPWLGLLVIAWRDNRSAAQRHPLPA